ncbi:MAG: hypothetical protein CMG88_00945 [Marinobacter sp.]|nr:hypothetical protein [Marinobacter sp.]
MSLIMSIGAFLPGLFGKEVSQKVAKALGFVILGLLLIAVLSLGKCAYDASVIEKHETEREIEAAGAREEAADQRLRDQINNARDEEELHDVVNAAPGGELSPAARALACERLRRIGRIPAACRSEGGDGSEARPD